MNGSGTAAMPHLRRRTWLLTIGALAISLAALFAALVAPDRSHAQSADCGNQSVSCYGVQITKAVSEQDYFHRLSDLGTKRVRMVLALDGQNPDPQIDEVVSRGYDVPLTIIDGAGFPVDPDTTPQGLERFKGLLGQTLDHYRSEDSPVISIENEMTARVYYLGSVDDYLKELRAAVVAVDEHNERTGDVTKISDGGLVSEGVQLATWDYLASNLNCAAANQYAQLAFGSVDLLHPILDYLECDADGGTVTNRRLADLLDRTNALIAGFRDIQGLDYVNFHWYESPPAALRTTVGFLRQVLPGKGVITNEIGQWDDSPETLRGLLDETAELHLPWVTWFGSDGDPAIGLFDEDGTIRDNGTAFAEFLQRCDELVNCQNG